MARTWVVGEGEFAGDTNTAIQRAVDRAAADGGGEVVVTGGLYHMHNALHLRDGVRVVGRDGPVLRKVPSVSSAIPDFVGYGHYEFSAAEPEKFAVGMGIHLLDDKAGGFYTTVATIVGRDGDLFFIDRPLNHDYHPRANGQAVSAFSIVEGVGVRNATVAGLVLDGNHPAETFRLNGCRGGGLFLLGCRDVVVHDVEIRQYHGDALSFQQCVDVLVEDCRIHDNTGHGLHPGSGSVRYVMRNVEASANGRCGVYYCLRTTHSILEGCRLLGNGEAGVSIGERDTDHLILDNRIEGNGGWGVLFRRPTRRGGDRVILRGNAIGPNAAGIDDAAEVLIPDAVRDIWLDANRFTPTPGQPAVRLLGGRPGVALSGNSVEGTPLAAEHVVSEGPLPALLPPQDFPAVGPAALAAGGASHLHAEPLQLWQEPAGA